jgi:hypothetical protein
MDMLYATHADGQGPVSLHVSGAEWRFSIASVKRMGRDLFLQIALQGPAICSLTVHVRDRIVFGVTAPRILTASCEWLLTRGAATHGYIDLAEGGSPGTGQTVPES